MKLYIAWFFPFLLTCNVAIAQVPCDPRNTDCGWLQQQRIAQVSEQQVRLQRLQILLQQNMDEQRLVLAQLLQLQLQQQTNPLIINGGDIAELQNELQQLRQVQLLLQVAIMRQQ